MPPIIDSIEDIELHKTHINNLQPEICDLCWMEVPFTKEELDMINSEDLEDYPIGLISVTYNYNSDSIIEEKQDIRFVNISEVVK